MKLFLPIFKMNFPEIVDLALPAEGGLPQPRFREHPQGLPEAGLQNHAQPLGHDPACAEIDPQIFKARPQGVEWHSLWRGTHPQ